MAKKVTSLFIEDTAIRFLVSTGKQAVKWASIPLEPGIVTHGQVQDKDKLAKKLKETFQTAGLNNKVILGISEPGSLYRIINLPKLPGDILSEAMKRESERVIPLPQNEIYTAYQVIKVWQEEMQVFLAAFSRNTVDSLISTLQAAGIKVISLDLVPLCLCRAINLDTAVVVSMRSSNFEIAIMVDHIPQVIRSLSLPIEAESLAEKIPTIAEELERTISFYNSSHADKPLDGSVPVYVDGELAEARDNWSELVKNFATTVSPILTPMKGEANFDNSQFSVNIGLAFKENLKEAAGSIVNFNALPKAFTPEKAKLSRVVLPIGVGIGIIILVFVALMSNSVRSDVNSSDKQAATIQKQTEQQNIDAKAIKAQTKTAQDAIKPLQDQIKTASANTQAFDQVLSGMDTQRNTIDTNISGIIALVPAGMNINSISLTDKVTISASAAEPDITLFARNLAGTNTFKSVKINSITLDESVNPGFYDFQIVITLR